MTTETEKASGAPNAEDDEQSFLPTVLAGVGILAVAALLIFWPSGDDPKADGAKGRKANAAARAKAGGAGDSSRSARAAGVGARPSDAATTPGGGRRNPAIKLPETRGMAPVMPDPVPKDPPPDATVDEKIDFYEKRLEVAVRVRDNRRKFAERLPQVKARIEAAPDPTNSMESFERRKKIVEDNLGKAEADVEEIEGKLAELRGG